MSNAAKKSAPASITKAEVTSNVDAGKNANLVNGILRMTYYESILQDSVKVNVIFGDVGLAVFPVSTLEVTSAFVILAGADFFAALDIILFTSVHG